MAIFLGMLPKDYQDWIMQQSVMLKEVSYENWRDHLINVVNQKHQMRQPQDMELGNIIRDDEPDNLYDEGWGGSDDWWDLDAIRGRKGKGKGKGCWQCGSPDHLRRNCPEIKGKGKGGPPKGFGKGGKGGYVPKR